MSHRLIPRLSAAGVNQRLMEIEEHLAKGRSMDDLPELSHARAEPNPTGGQVASEHDIRDWRRQVVQRMRDVDTAGVDWSSQHGIVLGRAIAEVVRPIPADAGHDGVWSFLSLVVFPDVVAERWYTEGEDLPRARWVGRPMYRDRNYLKLSWWRWEVMGELLPDARPPLGEDEFGALLERSALARNRGLVLAAARKVLTFGRDGGGETRGGRMKFTRLLMKRVAFETGPLLLDVLTSTELDEVVEKASQGAYRDLEASVGAVKSSQSVASEESV